MTATLLDVDIFEVLDFDPAITCDGSLIWYDGRHWLQDMTAIWVVYIKPVAPCGCSPATRASFTCAKCWEMACQSFILNANCVSCHKLLGPPSAWISHIETLKP